MGALAPAFFAGLMAIAIPVVIHMIHRERRETVPFPSLMFLRKIPYRSVRRQKIRHLLLLALRCLAIAMVVAAFARPFFEKKVAAAPAAGDSREVVILIDRSYSMANSGRWTRAVEAANTIAGQIRALDRVSVVAFASSAAQIVEPTSDRARVDRTLAVTKPGSETTRYASGLRMAAQILGGSDLPRREIVLISDFHRSGWSPNDEVSLPVGVAVRTIDVSRKETEDAAVASVSVARTQAGDRAHATVTARVTNLGNTPKTIDATLELAGRKVDTKRITIPARATSQAVFAGAPVLSEASRGVVRITADSQPSNDAWFFTVSEDLGAAALIIEPSRPRGNMSLFVTRALGVADDPPVRTSAKPVESVTTTDLRGRSLIILNETGLPTGTLGAELRARVKAGAMLFIVPGETGGPAGGPATTEWRTVLPANMGPVVDRGDGGRWASVDFSNALFEPFRVSRADFSSVSVTKYRTLVPTPDSAQVIAKLDDGAPLLVERAVGEGRILMWAGTLDPAWNDLPFHPLWVPLVHQLARRSVMGRDARSWFTAPHVLNLATEDLNAVVESPSGQRVRVAPDSQRPSIELKERGFYEIRGGTTAIGAGRPVAVNVDLVESDLSHMDAAELVAAMTSRGDRGASGALNTPFAGTAQELERRQAIWWYLLMAAVFLLAAETFISNRLSRQSLEQRITGVS
jgi:hypothetical protein